MSDLISRADALKPFCITPDGARIPEVDCDNFPVEFSVEFIKKHLLSLPSAEAVSRDAIISAKFHPLPYTHITPTDADAESYKRGWNDALDAVADNAPSAEAEEYEDYEHATLVDIKEPLKASAEAVPPKRDDLVEVVRCGSCKNLSSDGMCEAFADDCISPSATDFCSYGERREP